MVKICFIHRAVHDLESFLRIARLDENLSGSLVWDEEKPDILIASEWIYYQSDCFRKFKKLYRRSGIKVAYLGEALEPDFNIFDYCIGFNNRLGLNDGFIRLPSPYDKFSDFVDTRVNSISKPEDALLELKSKSGFCNFLYSNPHAHPMRDSLFYEISKYKRVDSLGKHLNNVATPGTGYGGHSHDCVPIKSAYKFSIAAENACFRGYTTEKILTSLEAHTVPVYWGNPDIEDDINPECFINVSKLSGTDELIDLIRRVDNNDSLWCDYVSKPWLTQKQANEHKLRTERYREQMSQLLAGALPGRLGDGYHLDLYREHFFTGGYHYDHWYSFLERLRK